MAPRLLPLLLLLAACGTSVTPPATKIRHDQPDEAAAYYAMRRGGTDDVQASLARARESMRRMPRYATQVATSAESGDEPLFGKWKFLGPGNVGGRTRVLLIDPADPNVMYAAGVSGGVWKSYNAGGQWAPIGDELMNIAVNSMVFHPTDRNVLYAGTGEGYFRENERGTALPLRGNGIFVTRDGGATWTQLPSTANENFHWVNDLAISRHDPSRVYAATRTGVWRSTDGGAHWQAVLPTTVKGGCLDLAQRTDAGGDSLFASCGTFEQATVYRHANAESSAPWQPVLSEPHMGRTTLAIAPSQQSVVYALSASNEADPEKYQGMLAVWRSEQNGDPGSWTAVMTNTSNDVLGRNLLTNLITADAEVCGGADEPALTMGWYCNTIAVDPADPNRLWAGGVDLFRSDDGGQTWGQASYWWGENEDALQHAFVHADQHVIAFHPHYNGTTNKIAYFGNDGGIFRTDDARAATVAGKDAICIDAFSKMTFTALNHNYGVTQFYHGAVFPDGRTFIGGTQDNGTILGSIDRGTDDWRRVHGGDGGYVAIHPTHPDLIYAESQGGMIVRSTDGGRIFRSFRTGLQDSFLFITPFTLDPNVPGTVWIGGTQMWRNTNSDRWIRASAPFAGRVSALAVAPGNSNRVVAATNLGDIFRSDAALTTTAETAWASTRPRGGFVSSLTFDPMDANVVYATYAGFGGTHVWRSIDGGATWAPRDGSGLGALPDMPVHSLAVDPTRRERLYLGTDLGVFVSLDGGLSWNVENSGFAAVVTETVTIAPGMFGPAIYAFTHGRGAWRAELVVPSGTRRRSVRH